MKAPTYKLESDLCADFIRWVKGEAGKLNFGVRTPRWTPYAETAGWDILLVADDGTQIGVQAKLKANLKVLAQAVPSGWDAWHEEGPDYRAILVPDADSSFDGLCAALGLMVIRPQQRYGDFTFGPGLDMEHCNGGWHYWSPGKRCTVPEFVPDVVAGASGPVQLTKWKIAALRIVATLELQGFVTRDDFRRQRIDPRRWTGPNGWLAATDAPGRFVRGPGLDFDRQHPEVYAQVLEQMRELVPTSAAPAAAAATPSGAVQPLLFSAEETA
jgi:hypothetical protein